MGIFHWTLLWGAWFLSWMVAVMIGGAGGTGWGLAVALVVYPWAALSAGAFWLAWRRAKQEEAGGTLFLRRCLSCGRAVQPDTVICPDEACDGVDFGLQWEVVRRDTAYRQREAALAAEEGGLLLRRRGHHRGWIAFMPAARFWRLSGWYMRGVFGRGIDMTEPEEMLWWSSRLLLAAGLFAGLVAAAAGPPGDALGWGRALVVAAAAMAASAAIALHGPGSPHARLKAAEHATDHLQVAPPAR